MDDASNDKALEEFRNAWKQEVQKKHIFEPPQASSSTLEPTIDDITEKIESLSTTETVPVTAMDHYVIAVDNERQGKLGKGNTYSKSSTQKKRTRI